MKLDFKNFKRIRDLKKSLELPPGDVGRRRNLKKDWTGVTQGSILVLGDSGKRNERRELLWKVVCECGRTTTLTGKQLKQGMVSCGLCKKEARTKIDHAKWKSEIVQRFKRTYASLGPDDKYSIISGYISGIAPGDLESLWNLHVNCITNEMRTLRDQLNIMVELNGLTMQVDTLPGHMTMDIGAAIDKIIDKSEESPLSKVISAPNSSELTPEEISFAFIYSSTQNLLLSIQESGMKKALKGGSDTLAYVQILGTYLLSKPNIKQFIVQLTQDDELNREVSKESVQGELITQIRQLKGEIATGVSRHARGQMLKAIELLGKTIGAYQEKISIEEVSPGDALDKLIEAAKNCSVDDMTNVPYEIEELE